MYSKFTHHKKTHMTIITMDDDGNILKRKSTSATSIKSTKSTKSTQNKKIKPRNELIVSGSGVDTSKLSNQEKDRFNTWRQTNMPKEFFKEIVFNVADHDMIEDILEPDSIMIMSELTKLFIG